MMRFTWNKYCFISLLLAVLMVSGCKKNRYNDSSLYPILFGMEGLDVTSKAALTQETINSRDVYVFGKMDNTTDIFSGTTIERQGSGLWFPTTSQTWESGSSYTFRGVATSRNNITISTLGTPSSGTLSTPGLEVFNSGMSIRVNQPSVYDEAAMIDYLLSRTFNVSDGASRPIVKLQMEHSMPAVEFYIIRSPFIYGACLKSLSLTGVYSSGTMTCSSPIVYGNEGTNSWSVSYSGDRTNTYSLTGTIASQVTIGDSLQNTDAVMKLIMMPQQLTPDAVLNVVYWVNERAESSLADNYVEYTESFQLYNFVPQSWSAAHRVRYLLTVDTGIHLVGSITAWRDVDFIEGTILPEIK